jgi:hypothetical protein
LFTNNSSNPFAWVEAEALKNELAESKNLLTFARMGASGNGKHTQVRRLNRKILAIKQEIRRRAKEYAVAGAASVTSSHPSRPRRPKRRGKRHLSKRTPKKRGTNPALDDRRAIVRRNRGMPASRLCFLFDQANISKTRGMQDAISWVAAYKSKRLRKAIDVLIWKDRHLSSR